MLGDGAFYVVFQTKSPGAEQDGEQKEDEQEDEDDGEKNERPSSAVFHKRVDLLHNSIVLIPSFPYPIRLPPSHPV